MKVEVKILRRSVGELSSPGRYSKLEDPDNRLITNPSVVNTFVNNPFVRTKDQPAQIIGIVDGRIVGGVGALPMRMIADGTNYETSAGPDILVNPEYRTTGLAIDFIEMGRTMSPDWITVDFYVSRMARKVCGLMGSAVFSIAQFALVRKSEEFFAQRVPSCLSWLACLVLDVLFALHRLGVWAIVSVKTWGWLVEDASDETGFGAFASLVAVDKHRFREDVSLTYLKWLFANDFDSVEMADKHLWRMGKGDVIYGYVLTRVSNKGRRARIIEWQATDGNEEKLPWMMLKIAMRVLGKTNAVVLSVSSDDVDLVQLFRRLLPRMPDQAATVGVGDGSPLEKHSGWRDQKSWRIRPAMGDCGFY